MSGAAIFKGWFDPKVPKRLPARNLFPLAPLLLERRPPLVLRAGEALVPQPVGALLGPAAVLQLVEEVGQVVQAGQPLLAVVPLEEVWVIANYKESQLRGIRPGQPAVVAVDAYGGREYRGKVDSIAAATGARFSILPPENASGNYVKVVQRVPVKIVLDAGQDPEHLLRPGMSVVPTILIQ